MSRSHRWSSLATVAALLIAGCSGNAPTIPRPSFSSAPTVLGRGTLAVIDRGPSITRILIFPPHSDTFTLERSIHTSRIYVNSAAFDRKGNLFVGLNDPASGGKYEVLEFNGQTLKLVREIENLPQWARSSVATDEENFLYVNTKSFIGGDVKIYPPGKTKPSLEVKDPQSPVTTLVGANSLWVGFEGAFADALAKYRLRSTDRSWFETTGNSLPVKLAVNPNGSSIAAKSLRNGKGTVDVTQVSSRKRSKLLDVSPEAMTSDDAGNLYVAELRSKIHRCTFSSCSGAFDTNATNLSIAVNPLDGMLYVACNGKASIHVYNPRTGSLVTYIPITSGGYPTHIAFEP